MNFRTLLLGSAAALMTVSASAALAADKTPAKPAAPAPAAAAPVDYVRICSAFGTGYFFAPGLDTCIRLQGTVDFTMSFGDNRNSSGPINFTGNTDDDHAFSSAAALTVITTSNTEYGQLTGQFVIGANIDGYGKTIPAGNSTLPTGSYVDRDYTVSSAFVQLGPVLAGYTGSAYDMNRGFTIDAGQGSSVTTNQLRLAFAMGNFGFLFSAEDYRHRYFDNAVVTGAPVASTNPPIWPNPPNNYPTGKFPDLVAAMTYQLGLVSGKVAVGYGDRAITPSWGAGAAVEVDLSAINKGDKLRGLFQYSAHNAEWVDNAATYDGAVGGRGNYFVYLVSYQHFWAQNGSTGAGALTSEVTASFRDTPSTGGVLDNTEVAFSSTYNIVRNLQLAGSVRWTQAEGAQGATTGAVRLRRSFP